MAQDLSKATDSLEDPFLRRSVKTALHLRRFMPFYVFGVIWAVTLALFPSIGPDKAKDDDVFASAPSAEVATSGGTAATDTTVADAAAGAATDAPSTAAAAAPGAVRTAPKAATGKAAGAAGATAGAAAPISQD